MSPKTTATLEPASALDYAQQCVPQQREAQILRQNLAYYTAHENTVVERPIEFKKGSVTIINFWATYCEPCVREMPRLVRLQRQLSQGLKPSLVFVSEDTGRDEIARYQRKHELYFNTFVSSESEVRSALGTAEEFPLPSTVVVNGNGEVVGCVRGELDSKDVDAIILLASMVR